MRRLIGVLLVAAALPACSNGGGREITVEMFEMGFEPSSIRVAEGEAVTFVVENTGVSTHELFVGDEAAQEAREALLAGGSTPEDPSSILLRNGESGELTYTFGDAGELLYGCHVIGHYAAGMVGSITVG
ncbi:MAG: cupredoxin domain-containing protein [Actinomycetota bacterium]